MINGYFTKESDRWTGMICHGRRDYINGWIYPVCLCIICMYRIIFCFKKLGSCFWGSILLYIVETSYVKCLQGGLGQTQGNFILLRFSADLYSADI